MWRASAHCLTVALALSACDSQIVLGDSEATLPVAGAVADGGATAMAGSPAGGAGAFSAAGVALAVFPYLLASGTVRLVGDSLVARYGADAGRAVEQAEAYDVSEYAAPLAISPRSHTSHL